MSITTTTPPNMIGQPEVTFRDEDFDAIIYSKGYDVIHEKAASCPCRSKSNGAPLSNCQNCGGTGWVLFNPTKTRMLLQSINMQTKYKEWSKENIGTVMISSRYVDSLGYMDRITIQSSDAIFSQVLFPQVYSNTLFAFTIYNIVEIKEVFLFNQPDQPLVKLESNEYSFTGNKIILDNSYSEIPDLTISIRYKHYFQYHVIDLVKETRRSFAFDESGKDKSISLPFHAIARRSHYVLDALNYERNNILDNSYTV